MIMHNIYGSESALCGRASVCRMLQLEKIGIFDWLELFGVQAVCPESLQFSVYSGLAKVERECFV